MLEKMFWLDMEMTGLNPERDRILEVAALVTDRQGNVLDSFEAVVRQPQALLDAMDAWCQEHHGKSGLLARVPGGVSETEAEEGLLALCDKHFASEKVVLCGNSIWQDRRFVERHLPRFTSRLHYRMLDVSSWKLVFENFYGKKFQKKEAHRALDDIRESIEEFRHYLSMVRPS